MKLFAVFILSVSVILCSILVMIYGWGLDVKSWSWVIGGYLWLFAVQAIIKAFSED